MRSAFERVAPALLAAAATIQPASANADDDLVDPSYGRVDGDVGLVVGAGGVVSSGGLRLQTELRLRYLDTVGVFATYEDAQVLGAAQGPLRVLATGFEIRPLFLYRWLQGHEVRVARFDLAIDSIGLDLGALIEEPRDGAFGSRAGLEVGLGLELPVFARATGPWIAVRGALRWSEAAMGAGVGEGPEDREAVLAVTLAWHQIVGTHVVDIRDRSPR